LTVVFVAKKMLQEKKTDTKLRRISHVSSLKKTVKRLWYQLHFRGHPPWKNENCCHNVSMKIMDGFDWFCVLFSLSFLKEHISIS